MQILELKSGNVLIEESTGQWLALQQEGLDLYCKYKKETQISDSDIKEFVDYVDAHLLQKQYLNETEKGLSILLTNQCNLECIHCYYSSSCDQPEFLKFDEEYTSFINEYLSDGLKWICFSGGEPLLNPDFSKFIEHASQNGLNISVLTNGTLIDDKIADLLASRNVKVQVSMDGTEEVYESIRRNGVFNEAVNGIKKLTDRGVSTDISFLPCKLTIGSFDRVVEIANQLNVNLIHMPFLEKYGRGEENYDLLGLSDDELLSFLENVIDRYFAGAYGKLRIGFAEELKKQLLHPNIVTSCKACKGSVLGLNYKNKVFPCSELIMDEYCIGTTSNRLDEIRNNFHKLISNLESVSVDTVLNCKICAFKAFCGGGCRVQALLSGGIYQPDKYCTVLKELYKIILNKIIETDNE